MRGASVKIEGLDELTRKIKMMSKVAENEAEKALTEIALDLQGKAQNLAPVDTGDLRGSAFAVVGNKDVSLGMDTDKNPRSKRTNIPSAGKTEAIVGFTEPYALRQHENIMQHPKGGEAKFLENPLKENVYKYLRVVNNAIARAVRK